MSRCSRLASPGVGSLAALLAVAILSFPGPVHARIGDPTNHLAPVKQRFRLCGSALEARDGGLLQTPYKEPGPLHVVGGLWVGARADLGQGLQTLVSQTAWGFEFWPVQDEQNPSALGGLRRVYADTSTAIVMHQPLGLRVTQIATPMQRNGYGEYVQVVFKLTNISAEYRPPGWDLNGVYLSLFADPDVGVAPPSGQYWWDDLAAFAQTPDGALAYAWDTPGGDDDTSERLGVLLPGQQPHAARIWAGPSGDPLDDASQYARMRGTSDDVQTIDPPATVPGDERVLLSVGPFTIPRGASQRFVAAIVCGEDLGTGTKDVVAAAPWTAPVHVEVAPNPVRLGGPGVRFGGLPVSSRVSVYETSGRLVATLVTDAGGAAAWDLVSSHGERVAAGVYLLRVDGGGAVPTGKVVVVR
jgi:hypothetical protein